MKKLLVLLLALSVIGVTVFAQDAAAAPAASPDPVAALAKKVPALGGSVKFTFGSADLANNPLTFSQTAAGNVGDLTVGIDNDQISAGVTIGTTPVITYTAAAGQADLSQATTNFRNTLSNAVDWYKNNKGNTNWDSDTLVNIPWYNTDNLFWYAGYYSTTKLVNLASTNYLVYGFTAAEINRIVYAATAAKSSLTVGDVLLVKSGYTVPTGTYVPFTTSGSYTSGTWDITTQDPNGLLNGPGQNTVFNTVAAVLVNHLFTAEQQDIALMADAFWTAKAGDRLLNPLPSTIVTKITRNAHEGAAVTGTTTLASTSGLTVYGDVGTLSSAATYYYIYDHTGNGAGTSDNVNQLWGSGNTIVSATLGQQIKNVAKALGAVSDTVQGVGAANPTVTASWKVSNAFFTLKKLFGVIDAGFIVNGTKVGIGSLVTSGYSSAKNGDPNVGFKLALSKDVVPGLSISGLLNLTSGAAVTGPASIYNFSDQPNGAAKVGGVAQPYNTAPLAGLQFNAGYAADVFAVNAGLMLGDLGSRDIPLADSFGFSIAPSLTLKDVAGLNVGVEFDLGRAYITGGDGNGVAYVFGANGIALGATVGISVSGIAPKVTFKMKTKEYQGAGDSNIDGTDATTVTSLSSEFDTIDNAATDLDIALAVDLKDLIGMKLVTINGDFGIMLQGSTHLGWSAGLGLDFNEIAKLPLTVGYTISQYDAGDNGMVNDITLNYKIDAATVGVEFKNTGSKNADSSGAGGSTNALYFTAGLTF